MNTKLAPLVFVFASLCACSAQVDADYQGEPLAQISGSVSNSRSTPVPRCEVTAIWVNSSASTDVWGANSVEVEGSFPSGFTLSIYEPPADELLNNFEAPGAKEARFGVAYLVANELDAELGSKEGSGLLGADTEHLLVYVPRDIPAGSDASYRLRSTPKAGFHIYGVYRPTEEERDARRACIEALPDGEDKYAKMYTECGGNSSFDDFVPLASDLDTPLQVELVDDPDQLDFADWT